MSRCRCGRHIAPIVINDILYEDHEVEGGFCGPLIKHEVRDLRVHLTAMEQDGNALCDALNNYLLNNHNYTAVLDGEHSNGFCRTCADQYAAGNVAIRTWRATLANKLEEP